METYKSPQEIFIGENHKLMNRLEEELGFDERVESLWLVNLNKDIDKLLLQRGKESGKLYLMAGGVNQEVLVH